MYCHREADMFLRQRRDTTDMWKWNTGCRRETICMCTSLRQVIHFFMFVMYLFVFLRYVSMLIHVTIFILLCARALSCGNHTCTKPCHSGPCTPCTRIPVTQQPCACGYSFPANSPIRTSCLSPLPTCTSKCTRMVSCGIHPCQQICHDSPCRACTTIVKRTCRCMQSVISMPCTEMKRDENEVDADGNLMNEIRCARVCKIKLACGRHRCNERCCSTKINRKLHLHHCIVM